MEKKQPGVMLYFDNFRFLDDLTDVEVGVLFRGIMEYAEYGIDPEFGERGLELVWKMIRPRIDYDANTYREKCENNAYSVYCREAKKRGEVPVEKRRFLAERERLQAESVDIE